MNLKIVTVEFVSVEEYDVARRGKDCKTVVVETIHMVTLIIVIAVYKFESDLLSYYFYCICKQTIIIYVFLDSTSTRNWKKFNI